MTRDDLIEVMARAICQAFYGTEWAGTSEFRQGICANMTRAALSALCDAIPGLADLLDGMAKIVPVQPVGGMVDAGARSLRGDGFSADCYAAARQTYAAMLTASPYRSANNDR